MFKKKIKIQIPIKNRCSSCGKISQLDDVDSYYVTHDDVCVVTYKCKCGKKDVTRQKVKFI